MFVKNTGKKMKKKLKEKITDCEFITKRLIFDNISDFKNCNRLYPCFNNIKTRELNQ